MTTQQTNKFIIATLTELAKSDNKAQRDSAIWQLQMIEQMGIE